MTAWRPAPRWLIVLSGLVVAVGVVVLFAGAVRIGVTVDETFHVVRLQNYLQEGWYLLDDDLGSSGPGRWVSDAYVYAPVTTLLLHVANVAAGNEAWAEVSSSQNAYLVRHVAIAVIGLVAVASAATMGRLVSRRWSWGLVSAAALVSIPMWSGHSMFNVKDVPVATGYTLVTLGCMLSLAARDRDRGLRPIVWATVLVGILLAVGTRPAMWAGAAAALGLVFLAVAWRVVERGSRRWSRLADVVVPAALAMALLALIYPSLFAHPTEWMLGSASESAGYQGESYRWYVPGMVAMTMPVLMLVVGAVGTIGRFKARWARRGGITVADALMVLLLLQAMLLPTLLAIRGTALSGGLRHVLFAAPAVAVLVAAAISQILDDLSARAGRAVATVMVSAAFVLPSMAQLQMFPYSYAYANELIDIAGFSPPLDPWQGSFREFAPLVSDDAFVVCGPQPGEADSLERRMPNGGQSWLDVSQNCTRAPLGVLAPYVGRTDRDATVDPTFLALMTTPEPSPRGCQERDRITRQRLHTTLFVSEAWECPLLLRDYTGPIQLDGAGSGAEYLLGGWTGSGGDDWATAEEPASLGFRLAGAATAPRLAVSGDAAGATTFLIDNEPASAESTATGWVLRPSPGAEGVGGREQHVLTVLPAGGDVRVWGVEVMR